MKTLVFVASPNPDRVSYLAVHRLMAAGHEVLPLGFRSAEVAGLEIITDLIDFEKVHTITLYLRKERQAEFYDYLLSLRPRRIIFNPGAENPELAQRARQDGIEVVNACTLVMLSIGIY